MATGKRAGARRATPARSTPKVDGGTLGYAAGITACVVAWGYLVYMAIDFGGTARAGNSSAWLMLGLAFVGAMACLFAGLMLAARLASALGFAKSDQPDGDSTPAKPEPSPPAAAPAPPVTTEPTLQIPLNQLPPAAPPPASPPPEPSPTPAPKARAKRQPGGRRISRR